MCSYWLEQFFGKYFILSHCISGVETIEVTIVEATVPTQETTYYCQSVELPHDEEYHIIATEGIIVNANVVHHMLLYACEDPGKYVEIKVMDNSRVLTT